MRKSRLISLPLAAVLSVAACAGPAAARPDVARNPNVAHRSTSSASSLPADPTRPTDQKPISSYASAPVPPTWPTNPQAITEYRGSVQATDNGFDWDSAGIGAAVSAAILAAGLAGFAVMRRRRHPPQTLSIS